MKLVKMVRSASEYPKPHEADVHPDEVESWRAYGWREAGEPAPEKPAAYDAFDAMSDEDLLAYVQSLTGKRPHANTSREKLLAQARAG